MSLSDPYRRFGRVEWRPSPCRVHLDHCSKHNEQTCANQQPPHCAAGGRLTCCPFSVQVDSNFGSYQLEAGKLYCEECYFRASDVWYGRNGFMSPSQGESIYVAKLTPIEYAMAMEAGMKVPNSP